VVAAAHSTLRHSMLAGRGVLRDSDRIPRFGQQSLSGLTMAPNRRPITATKRESNREVSIRDGTIFDN
jgi:hypothetical protein